MTLAAKTLSDQQLAFWNENGYLLYDDRPLLDANEIEQIGAIMHDVAVGTYPKEIPEWVYSVEGAVVRGEIKPESAYDKYRIIRFMHKFDDYIMSICKKPAIIDVVQDLLGTEDIKIYTDQLFMKPPFHGGAIHWHQDSAA